MAVLVDSRVKHSSPTAPPLTRYSSHTSEMVGVRLLPKEAEIINKLALKDNSIDKIGVLFT